MAALMRTLYVGGLPPESDENTLQSLFAEFGALQAARVVKLPSGRSRGFGYVTFLDDSAAIEARRKLDGKELDGTRLRVALAK